MTAHPILQALRARRVELGLSQQQVADRSGTSQSAISEMETGQVSPTLTLLDRVAATLGYVPIIVPDLVRRPSLLTNPAGVAA